uniref:multicopper oxidase domain-containing protein n=1 Tax=Gracilimonas tropica TaxID=454600 RepID=UPI00047687AA
MSKESKSISRREFLRYTTSMGVVAGLSTVLPAYAFAGFDNQPREILTPQGKDNVLDLTISKIPLEVDGQRTQATAINGQVPGPLIRLKEGEEILIRVTNELDEDTSIHWHGIILPFQMDGVPGVSFDGIKPGETFEYR